MGQLTLNATIMRLPQRALTLGLVLVALALSLPAYLRAQTTASAEESVVVSSTDDALTRQAKLKRAWVVYREIGSPTLYALTKTKQKRAIQTLEFFSAFNANYHVRVVAQGRLANFTTGEPITSTQGLNPDDFIKAAWRWRLVKVANKPAVYLITPDGKRRVVVAQGVFHRFGWEFRDVETISETELNSYTEDSAISDDTMFEEEVNVDTTHKRLTREGLMKRLSLKGKNVVRQRLVKAIGDTNVYLIMPDGTRRRLASEAAANRLRLNLKDVTEVTSEELNAIPEASVITETTTVTNLNQTVTN